MAILNVFVTNIHYFQLPLAFTTPYWSLVILNAFALYLYPLVINATHAHIDPQRVRKIASLLPLYSIGLSLLAMFGFFVQSIPVALKYEYLFRHQCKARSLYQA
ncbi:MAG: hypothetical protein QW292_05565 [Candidatus Parvarchaeota archaeon]